MKAHCLFPAEGLPPGIYPRGETLEWLHGDTRREYRARGGHPVYGEHDITYTFNASGYRCDEFDRAADLRVVAIGCSYVLGIGLAQRHLFHERFAARLEAESGRSVVVWNLATSGASNDYISRLLLQALPTLDPHVVLVNFTHLRRREHISVDNRMVKYLPSHRPDDPVERQVYGHLDALTSPYDDEVNYFRNYKTVEHALRGRCWLYSGPEWHPTPAYTDLSRFVGLLLAADRARDHDHPGPESHAVLAALYWNRFLALGGLDAVRG